MAFSYKHTFIAPSTASIAAGQTLTAAGNLNLNGSLAQTITPNDGGTVSFFPTPPNTITASDTTVSGGYNVPVTLTSTGNLSGINFTITGFQSEPYNPFIPVTEVIAGPSNSTVTSTKFYNRILSISASAAVGTTVSAGHIGTNAFSRWLPVGGPGQDSTIAVAAYINSGNANYTVQHTFDNVFDPNITPNVFNSDDASVVGATTSKDSNYFAPPTAIRILLNTITGSLTFYVNQTGLTS